MNLALKTNTETRVYEGYYWVISNEGNKPEIAYYTFAKRWLFIGTQVNFTPYKVLERVNYV